jgi:hypothetical protein
LRSADEQKGRDTVLAILTAAQLTKRVTILALLELLIGFPLANCLINASSAFLRSFVKTADNPFITALDKKPQ